MLLLNYTRTTLFLSQESSDEGSNWAEDRQRFLRCSSRRLAARIPEPLEMHHSAVLEATTSTLNVAHEALLLINLPQLEQVCIKFLFYS